MSERNHKKESLRSDLIQARHELISAASSLTEGQLVEVFLGTWTVMDLLAHLIGWDYANIEALHSLPEGRLPAFYSHYDHNWRSYNARLVENYGRKDLTDLVSTAKESHSALLTALGEIPSGEINKDWGVRFKRYKVTIARTLDAEIKDERTHRKQIEEYFGKIP